MSRLGGVVFRVFGTEALSFLPSESSAPAAVASARKVTAIPEMASIPGAPIELRGVALVDGDMIPIVEVGADANVPRASPDREKPSSPTGAMLVCAVLGECVGLIGIDVLATGFFDIDKSEEATNAGKVLCVRVPSPIASAPPLIAATFDLAGLIARVREGRWAV